MLALDTSSRRAELALRINAHTYASTAELGVSHEVVLSKLLQEVLDAANINLNQVGRMIVGAGPGSFTGLRIGYAFAKGLALSCRLSVTSASSLEARARIQLRDSCGVVVSLSDARRTELFCGIYARTASTGFHCLHADSIVPLAELPSLVHKAVPPAYAESGVSLICDAPCEYAIEGLQVFEGNAALGLLEADQALTWTESVSELAQLSPNYLRAVAAKSIKERAAERR